MEGGKEGGKEGGLVEGKMKCNDTYIHDDLKEREEGNKSTKIMKHYIYHLMTIWETIALLYFFSSIPPLPPSLHSIPPPSTAKETKKINQQNKSRQSLHP